MYQQTNSILPNLIFLNDFLAFGHTPYIYCNLSLSLNFIDINYFNYFDFFFLFPNFYLEILISFTHLFLATFVSLFIWYKIYLNRQTFFYKIFYSNFFLIIYFTIFLGGIWFFLTNYTTSIWGWDIIEFLLLLLLCLWAYMQHFKFTIFFFNFIIIYILILLKLFRFGFFSSAHHLTNSVDNRYNLFFDKIINVDNYNFCFMPIFFFLFIFKKYKYYNLKYKTNFFFLIFFNFFFFIIYFININYIEFFININYIELTPIVLIMLRIDKIHIKIFFLFLFLSCFFINPYHYVFNKFNFFFFGYYSILYIYTSFLKIKKKNIL